MMKRLRLTDEQRWMIAGAFVQKTAHCMLHAEWHEARLHLDATNGADKHRSSLAQWLRWAAEAQAIAVAACGDRQRAERWISRTLDELRSHEKRDAA